VIDEIRKKDKKRVSKQEEELNERRGGGRESKILK